MNICLKHNQMYEDYCRYCGIPIYVNTNSAAYGEKDKDERNKI